jgi:sterol desaturase/sphingolipid hydroxylase (fatty acid hydroxylase superfamily)
MKQKFVDLLPPLTVAAVLLFWANAPKAWVDTWWVLMVAIFVVLGFVQIMEYFAERHQGWRLNRTEFFTDIFYVAFGSTAITWLSTTLGEPPVLAAKQAFGIATPWLADLPFLVQVAMALFLFEFGQYWMHRLMHNNSWLWATHAPHHHITQLNAMKGYVGNPIELFLISLGILALFDWDKAALFAAISVGSTVAIYAHANVRADPPIWYAFFFTTIRNHSLHHTALSYEDTRCNYGNSLILLDRIFGTYKAGESTVVGQGERQRLSIVQQWVFPFQPLLDRLRAKRAQGSAPSN